MSFNPRGTEPRQVARMARIVWAVMLFSLFLYAFVLKMIPAAATSPPPRQLQLGFVLLGMGTGAVVLYFRLVRIARLIASVEPMDDRALTAKLWSTHIICYVLSEATALYGFVLAFMHGDPGIYGPLYLGGVLLMLLCYPRFPANEAK